MRSSGSRRLYNGLISKRNRVENAWSQIDVQLKRRHDLIPNLVETVKGYAAHERGRSTPSSQARNAAMTRQATPAPRPRPRTRLTGALRQLFALSEAYPDLKANQNFLALQEELSATEGRVAYARQFYNDSVLTYNTKIQQFPAIAHRRPDGLQAPRVLRGRGGRPRGAPRPVLIVRRTAGPPSMYELIASNKRRSILLVAGFVARRVARRRGLRHRVRLRLAGHGHRPGLQRRRWPSPRTGRRTPSRWPSAGPSPADPAEYRRLYNLVEGLTIASGLPMPRIYIVDDPAPNAFATGRNPRHAAIAVTTGLLEKMNRVELEGVLAHELSHIKNYDILVSTLAVTLVGAVALLSDIALRTMWWNGGRVAARRRPQRRQQPPRHLRLRLLILAPLLGQADAGGRQPPPGGAGRRLRRADDPLPARADLRAREAAGRHDGHPLGLQGHRPPLDRAADVGRRRPRASSAAFNRLFDTHPPLEERIAALREL